MNKIDKQEYWEARAKASARREMIIAMSRTGYTYRQISAVCSDIGIDFSYSEFMTLCNELGVTPVRE